MADSADLEAKINGRINDLFPQPQKAEAHKLFDRIKDAVAAGEDGRAAAVVSDLLQLTVSTNLKEPDGETTSQAVEDLFDLLFEFVGFEVDDDLTDDDLTGPELIADLIEQTQDDDDGTVALAVEGEDNLILTDSSFAGTFIESDDLDEDLVIVIERLTEEEREDGQFGGACLPTESEQREGCYRFDRYPEGSFLKEVRVGVCQEEPLLEEFQLFRFSDPQEGVVPLPNVAFPELSCAGFTSTLARSSSSSLPVKLARAAWGATGGPVLDWLAPRPLQAVNVGFGGATTNFSRIGWVEELDVDILAGDGQSAAPGTRLPTDPQVRVTHLPEDDDDHPIEGVDVSFAVDPGDGTLSTGQAQGQNLTVTTDGDGLASVAWTLGSSTGTQQLVASVPRDDVVFKATATGETILFSSTRDGEELWTMNPDGSGLQQLTDNSFRDFSPAWSPDGSRVAFMSDRDGPDIDIYTLDLATGAVTRLTSDPGFDSAPDWSPDGTRIVFHSDRDGDAEIYTMGADDGLNLEQLTDNDSVDVAPRWSPDGTRIVFHSDRDVDREIYTMNPDGSNVVKLTDNSSLDAGPAWSPDGSQIAFSSDRTGDREIWIMDSDGSAPVQVTSSAGDFDINPSWSPDGTMIAFEKDDGSQRDIWRIGVNGTSTNTMNLTDDQPTADDQFPDWRRP